MMLLVICSMQSCARSTRNANEAISEEIVLFVDVDHPMEFSGLSNVVAFHEGYLSGSAPQDDSGFRTLEDLGVKTIISVDGAVPSVELAQAHGIRYIHLPVGYGGFSQGRSLELASATREFIQDGGIYVHCHYGKHRSAAVAGAVTVMLGWQSPDEAIVRMKIAGASSRYTGLYACVADAMRIDDTTLDEQTVDFTSVWQPSSFTSGMIEMAKSLDRLRLIEQAGWKAPRDHPDLAPVAEAGLLADLHRILASNELANSQSVDFSTRFDVAIMASRDLESLLLSSRTDHERLSGQLNSIVSSCAGCHDRYRIGESPAFVQERPNSLDPD